MAGTRRRRELEAIQSSTHVGHLFKVLNRDEDYAAQREPNADEIKIIAPLLSERLIAYQNDEKAADELLKVGQMPVASTLDKAQLAAWTHVARVLLNLHETITRG